jgi:hypothetical protein
MAQYMLSVHAYVNGAPPPSDEEMAQIYADVEALNQQMAEAGVELFAGGLLPPDQSTVVREDNGQVVMTDGPLAEVREHLGGFWVIKVDDHDAALEWASRATRACRATIEVRQFEPDSEV